MDLSDYILPIYSGKTIIAQCFIADGYLITAAHIIKDFPSCFVVVNGIKRELAKEEPAYIGEGDVYHNSQMIDIALFNCKDVDSPLFITTYSPSNGDYFDSFCVTEDLTLFIDLSMNFNKLDKVVAFSDGDVDGNYFFCRANRHKGCSGSPLLKGNAVTGIMHGGNNNGYCAFLKSEIVLSIISKLERKNLSTEVTKEDNKKSFVDEFGVRYSSNGKKLIKGANIKEYVVNEKTEIICDDAFCGCEDLNIIDLPSGLLSIGKSAFCDCINLKNLDLPQSLESIGDYAFHRTSIKEIVFPVSLSYLGSNAFSDPYQESQLERVTFNGNLSIIKDRTFCGCINLKTIKLPGLLNKIEECAFSGCNNLEEIDLPNTLKEIGKYAFSHCYSLKVITLPESIEYIGRDSFRHLKYYYEWDEETCYDYLNIIIPSSVKELEDNPFVGCRILCCKSPYYSFDNGILYSLDKRTMICVNPEIDVNVEIPDSVECICNEAFNYYRNRSRIWDRFEYFFDGIKEYKTKKIYDYRK